MRLIGLFFILLFAMENASFAAEWGSREWSLPELLELLRTTPTGKALLAKAQAKDQKFLTQIYKGRVSFTENTYSRSYSLLDGQEEIHVSETITIGDSLAKSDAVVDLAHELTHFAYKQFMSPYHLELTKTEFIHNGIEGRGGELDAFAVECRVAWELQKKYLNFPDHSLCKHYRVGELGFSRALAKQDYYAVGKIVSKSDASLLQSFPAYSQKLPVFTSSYAHLPYPLALAKEYEDTRRSACENNAKKYKLIASQSTKGRAPSSLRLESEVLRLTAFRQNFCQN